MSNTALLAPMTAMVCLTFVVWLYMYVHRLASIVRLEIDPQSLNDPSTKRRLSDHAVWASDNLKNLFELPVLFYAGCLAVLALGWTDSSYLWLAWFFVTGRTLHSAVQCFWNRVPARFVIYQLSCLPLWVFWGRIVWRMMH